MTLALIIILKVNVKDFWGAELIRTYHLFLVFFWTVTYPPFGIDHEVNQTFSYDEDRMIAEGSFKYEVNAKPYLNGKMKIRAAPSDIPRAIYQFDLEVT